MALPYSLSLVDCSKVQKPNINLFGFFVYICKNKYMTHNHEHHPNFYKYVLFGAMLIAIVCVMMVSSCTTQHYIRKTDKVVTKLFAKDSVKATKTLIKYIPIQTVTKVSTRYIKGNTDTINTITTYTVDCDSAIIATLDEAARHHVKCPPCPPQTIRVDTFIRDSMHVVIDPLTAIELSKTSKERDEYKAKFESRAKYVWITWIGAVSLLLLIILLVYMHQQGKVWDFASKMGKNG